jgi:ribosomal protein S18 acetylase RimI-like enzyme
VTKRNSGFGGELVEAHVGTGADGQAVVQFSLTPKGADQFAVVTRMNIGRRMAIVLHGKVISGGLIGGEMTGGKVEISGYYTDAEAYGLAAEMNAAVRDPRQSGAMNIQIAEVYYGRAAVCRQVLDDLPEWFGIPGAKTAYIEASAELPMIVASVRGDQVGFISLKQHTDFAVEMYVLGVKRLFHRRGIGRALVHAAAKMGRQKGLAFLTVKTVDSTTYCADWRPNPTPIHTLLTSLPRSRALQRAQSGFPDTPEISRGKNDRLPRTRAGFTTPAFDDGGLRDHMLARPAG